MNTYKERCNNQEAKQQWESSGLVPLDSLRLGDVFECIEGTFWQLQSTNRTGTKHAEPWGWDSEPTDFIASARVRPVMRKTYVDGGDASG